MRTALEALDTVVGIYGIRSINDVPCGDFNWMPSLLTRHPDIQYHGYDIVPDIVDQNRRRYPRYHFTELDLTKQVPLPADLVFCKDLLNHLVNFDVARALRSIRRSGSRYLMASNNKGHLNAELILSTEGASRFLDITLEPFRLPAPIWSTDYLSMWRLDAMRPWYFDDLCHKLTEGRELTSSPAGDSK